MKNIFDAKQWVLETLLTGGVKSVINGGIYKDRRPSGSTKEDIVINDIAMDNSYLQDAVLNVNCYVPYLDINQGGTTQYQPNHARIKEIATAIYPLLNEVYTRQYNLTIVSHKSFEEQAEKANYINFRINLKAYN